MSPPSGSLPVKKLQCKKMKTIIYYKKKEIELKSTIMYKKQKYRTIKGYRIKNKNVIKISNSNTTLYVIYKLDRIGTRHHRSVTSCRCCFSFVEFIAVKKKEYIKHKRKQKRQKEKKKRFIRGFVPGTICSALLHLIITPRWMIA